MSDLVNVIQEEMIAFLEQSARSNGCELVYDNADGFYRFKPRKKGTIDTRMTAEAIEKRLIDEGFISNAR